MKPLVLFIAAALAAQEPPKMPPSLAPVISSTSSKGTFVIDPKARSNDLVQAFDQLRKDKPTLKILVRTASGSFSGVSDISTTTGGTLLLLRVLSAQGSRIQVVPVEEVTEITYSP